jgi:hypothetical protein
MNRVLILVEGPTERAVVEQVFAPYFGPRSLWLYARVVGKPGHKGGIRSFEAVRKEVSALLNQESNSLVSTFFDYYGLPATWPGIKEARGRTATEKARIVESAMRDELRKIVWESVNLDRFLPHIQMHELETLLFANPQIMASAFEQPDLESPFAEIVRQCGSCEEINDDPESAPSKRILQLFPAYRKGSSINAHAPIITRRIGVDAIRQACPHFSEWIRKLENLRIAKDH